MSQHQEELATPPEGSCWQRNIPQTALYQRWKGGYCRHQRFHIGRSRYRHLKGLLDNTKQVWAGGGGSGTSPKQHLISVRATLSHLEELALPLEGSPWQHQTNLSARQIELAASPEVSRLRRRKGGYFHHPEQSQGLCRTCLLWFWIWLFFLVSSLSFILVESAYILHSSS